MKRTYREAELVVGLTEARPSARFFLFLVATAARCAAVIVERDLPSGRLPTPESSANKKLSRNRFLGNQSSGGSIAFPGTAPVNGE